MGCYDNPINIFMNRIEITGLNTGFDGALIVPDLDGNVLKNWVAAHDFVLRARDIEAIQALQKQQEIHPVRQLINDNNPRILALTEVMPDMPGGSESVKILKEEGFKMILGRHKEGDQMRRTTLIAYKKENGEDINFHIPRIVGGNSCGLLFPDSKMISLAVHLSAFVPAERWRQLIFTASRVYKYCQEGYDVILTGDFNTEYKGLFKLVFNRLPLQHKSLLSFPPQKLIDEVRNEAGLQGILLRRTLGKEKNLDHMFISNEFKINKFDSQEVNSDHKALILEAERA